jgi:hypothetical protein
MRQRVAMSLTAILIVSGLLVSCTSNEFSKPNSSTGLNGSFEVQDDGYPVNWAFFPNPERNDAVHVSMDSAHPADGAHSVKLEVTGSDRPTGFRSRRIPVQPGKTYTIGLSVKQTGGILKVNRIVQDASGKTNIRSQIIAQITTPSTEWQHIEETLAISEKEAHILLIVLFEGAGTLWCDHVYVTEHPV